MVDRHGSHLIIIRKERAERIYFTQILFAVTIATTTPTMSTLFRGCYVALLLALFLSSPSCASAKNTKERVESLPGYSGGALPAENIFTGFVTVDAGTDTNLFYMLVEAEATSFAFISVFNPATSFFNCSICWVSKFRDAPDPMSVLPLPGRLWCWPVFFVPTIPGKKIKTERGKCAVKAK